MAVGFPVKFRGMIHHFEPSHPAEPDDGQGLQWWAAVGGGLIAGMILLIVPRGSPWSALTFFSAVIMGRSLGPYNELPPFWAWVIHLGVSIIHGLLIAKAVSTLRRQQAIIVGGAVGLVLYVINFGVVSTWWPNLRGNELSVVFTHIVFGLIAAGAYRGLLRRRISGEGSA